MDTTAGMADAYTICENHGAFAINCWVTSGHSDDMDGSEKPTCAIGAIESLCALVAKVGQL